MHSDWSMMALVIVKVFSRGNQNKYGWPRDSLLWSTIHLLYLLYVDGQPDTHISIAAYVIDRGSQY